MRPIVLFLALTSSAHAADIRVGSLYGDYATLTEAIAAAQPGDRLLLESQPFVESVVIDKDLTLLGVEAWGTATLRPDASGAALRVQGGATVHVEFVNLQGGGAQRLYEVGTGSSLSHRYGSITGGRSLGAYGDGGAVYVENGGSLILRDAWVDQGGRATRGGIVFGARGSAIEIVDSTLNAGTAIDLGGCLYSEGEVRLEAALVQNCALTTTDPFTDGSKGGAYIAMGDGGVLLGTGSQIRGTGAASAATAAEVGVLLDGATMRYHRGSIRNMGLAQVDGEIDWSGVSFNTSALVQLGTVPQSRFLFSRFCSGTASFQDAGVYNSLFQTETVSTTGTAVLEHLALYNVDLVVDGTGSRAVNLVVEDTSGQSIAGTGAMWGGLFPTVPWGTIPQFYGLAGAPSWGRPQCTSVGPLGFTYDDASLVTDNGVLSETAIWRGGDLDGTPADLGPMGGAWADASKVDDADGDGWSTQRGDCDDTDPNVHPLAPEICDGIDNDCNTATVDGVAQVWYPDADGDGYPTLETNLGASCTAINGATTIAINDCADGDPLRFPGNPEVCDGIDNDCNGQIDEAGATVGAWFADSDGDGFGAGSPTLDCAGTLGGTRVLNNLDCDDSTPGRGTLMLAPDVDGDGYGTNQGPVIASCTALEGWGPVGDCWDREPAQYEGAAELCNADDDDCDGLIDEGLTTVQLYWDGDYDGVGNGAAFVGCDPGVGSGYATVDGDCDDGFADVYAGADEICDGRDNDCDGQVDEGAVVEYWLDADGDGFTVKDAIVGCAPDGALLAPSAEFDCDDNNPYISPLALDDNCDGVDDDCDGFADDEPTPFGRISYYRDADEDGVAITTEFASFCGAAPPGWALFPAVPDCDDADPTIYPGATEVCDGIDQDCDTVADNGLTFTTYYDDVDQDGLGGAAHIQCAAGSGQVATGGDCHDGDPNVGLAGSWFRDADGDGYGNPDNAIINCFPGDGWLADSGDCDDTAADVNPLGTETCDGRDEDCDLTVDEDLSGTVLYEDIDGDGYGGDPVVACAPGLAITDVPGDCDDSVATIYPGATEFCGDSIDQDCNGADLVCDPTDDDGDGFCGGACTDGSLPGDCNDADPAINPWAIELCDGIDNDCDGRVDEHLSADADGDGRTKLGSCEGTADDCNDFLADVFPGATETCNGLDDDCDDRTDEGVRTDADGDGFPGPGCPLLGVPVDCDDSAAGVYPYAEEIPGNGIDDDCDGVQDELPSSDDDDGDGYCEGPTCSDGSLPGDCDDTDPAINPGPAAVEVIDGIDNDCDGVIDSGVTSDLDRDGDGYTIADGDCNDLDAQVHPGALEVCNGFDDDCDGYVPAVELDQDGDQLSPCKGDCDDTRANVRPGLAEDCSDGLDNNCSGEADEDSDYDQDGYTTCAGDCADLDPLVNPGADEESCNQLDDDCDMTVDEGLDADQDGVIACTVSQLEGGCVPDLVICDCDDNNRLVAPGLAEICGDGLDNDCDGEIDNDEDLDGDGWRTCEGDCNDGNPFVSPGTPETCDGKDNDCDLQVDETFDADADGWLTCRGDCDDTMVETYPFGEELCDLSDNDCNTVVDDPWPDIDEDGYTECHPTPDCAPGDPSIGPEVAEVCGDTIDNDCDGAVDWDDTDCDSGVFPNYCGCNASGSPVFAWGLLLPLIALRRKEVRA